MKGLKALFFIGMLIIAGGCGIFKEDCNCPTFGKQDQEKPADIIEAESATAATENS